MSDGRHLLLLTLNYTQLFAWVSNFQLQRNIVMAMVISF